MKRLPSVEYPAFKAMLTRLGRWVSPKMVYNLNGALNYLSVGRWFHDRSLKIPFHTKDRDEFYRHVSTQCAGPVTYLEFGVFDGETLSVWLKLVPHPDSRFHGFDSFEGLPE